MAAGDIFRADKAVWEAVRDIIDSSLQTWGAFTIEERRRIVSDMFTDLSDAGWSCIQWVEGEPNYYYAGDDE